MAGNGKTIIEISPKTIFWALGIGILAVLVYMVRDVIAVLIFAVIISSALEPLLGYAQSKKIPRLLTLVIVYFLFFVFFAALIYILLPLVLDQLRDFSQNYPTYFGKIEEAVGTINF
ncbi:MAG: AI-2E family transporter, partial [Candidatus Azambacteria bacterium]|nr:AI-2E family transporter [Candidatus Azambacteria bacterium]